MQKIIDFLNGKKTVIGGSVLAVVALLASMGIHVPSITAEDVGGWVDKVTVLLGGILWVVGLIHKLIKWIGTLKHPAPEQPKPNA